MKVTSKKEIDVAEVDLSVGDYEMITVPAWVVKDNYDLSRGVTDERYIVRDTKEYGSREDLEKDYEIKEETNKPIEKVLLHSGDPYMNFHKAEEKKNIVKHFNISKHDLRSITGHDVMVYKENGKALSDYVLKAVGKKIDKYIDENASINIMFDPEEMSLASSSFAEGFTEYFVNKYGRDGYRKLFSFDGSSNMVKNTMMEDIW